MVTGSAKGVRGRGGASVDAALGQGCLEYYVPGRQSPPHGGTELCVHTQLPHTTGHAALLVISGSTMLAIRHPGRWLCGNSHTWPSPQGTALGLCSDTGLLSGWEESQWPVPVGTQLLPLCRTQDAPFLSHRGNSSVSIHISVSSS